MSKNWTLFANAPSKNGNLLRQEIIKHTRETDGISRVYLLRFISDLEFGYRNNGYAISLFFYSAFFVVSHNDKVVAL